MSRTVEVKVPDIGDFRDVEVIEVLVSPGDRVSPEDSLITLESDKATMEVPSPHAGVVRALRVRVGDRVSEGSPICVMEVEEGEPAAAEPPGPAEAPVQSGAAEAPAAAAQAAPGETGAAAPTAVAEAAPGAPGPFRPPPVEPVPVERPGGKPHASPAVRRFARELGVDLARVRGSGPKGRILKEDVQAYVKEQLTAPQVAPHAAFALPEMPQIDFAKFGQVERVERSRIRRLSAQNLHRAWLHVPHVTQHDEADITELEAFRRSLRGEAEARGVRLTLLAFLMKAVAAALREHPHFNASLDPDGEHLILKRYYHIGVAVDTPEGLVVPVIRDVDAKGVWALAEELAEVSARARERRLRPEEMQGASFSISSLGGIGGTAFTPIVNAPEVAILGVSRAQMRPVWNGSEFVPRLMLPLSLSYDHRVIDGADAARFTTHLARTLGDVRRLLL
ncbi:pyruvate dehydrogenase E2 component (dihydrolipoamide acetyltransferase) [Inmirania thermothiophila]|uniref:Acetyltransferase component of pyruvate dehydrogenase complex n=1 Tax=Inmirania thermothiophila TaxID=1750597 RepID=A0A3N1YCC2_9GAMM|nr:pyruvate dehydrogenase E2 component (dihydrolipoamide acetyltransferase) [Inmirania thermothiophila]